MARAQAQYLRIYTAAGVTIQRWQSYYSKPVNWAGGLWVNVPFAASGFSEGLTSSETDISVTAPASGLVVNAFELAITNSHLVDLTIYQFDTLDGNELPQEQQQLLLSYTGQVLGGGGSLTSLQMDLGTPVPTIGAQVPPRTLTSAIMGTGCRL
jgi:hypothetical protein